MRCRQRLGRVEGAAQPVVLTLIRAVFSAPHLQADLKRLLETLEALGSRREQESEPLRLLFVPSGADTEHRTPARQDVESGDHLGKQAGLAVHDAGDESEQAHTCRLRGQVY